MFSCGIANLRSAAPGLCGERVGRRNVGHAGGAALLGVPVDRFRAQPCEEHIELAPGQRRDLPGGEAVLAAEVCFDGPPERADPRFALRLGSRDFPWVRTASYACSNVT